MWKSTISTGVGFAERAVWSRAARRHVKNKDEGTDEDGNEEEPSFGFKLHVEDMSGGIAGSIVTIRWLKGHDSVLFESFCGMVKRKLEESMK
jgi:23S rRNA (adenine1618-N6)-methyltransferase